MRGRDQSQTEECSSVQESTEVHALKLTTGSTAFLLHSPTLQEISSGFFLAKRRQIWCTFSWIFKSGNSVNLWQKIYGVKDLKKPQHLITALLPHAPILLQDPSSPLRLHLPECITFRMLCETLASTDNCGTSLEMLSTEVFVFCQKCSILTENSLFFCVLLLVEYWTFSEKFWWIKWFCFCLYKVTGSCAWI